MEGPHRWVGATLDPSLDPTPRVYGSLFFGFRLGGREAVGRVPLPKGLDGLAALSGAHPGAPWGPPTRSPGSCEQPTIAFPSPYPPAHPPPLTPPSACPPTQPISPRTPALHPFSLHRLHACPPTPSHPARPPAKPLGAGEEWEFAPAAKALNGEAPFFVVAYDYGVKHNILRRLTSFGCKVTVVPADYPAEKVLALNPDGVFFSNGPVSRFCIVLYCCI